MPKRVLYYTVIGEGWVSEGQVELKVKKSEEKKKIAQWLSALQNATNCDRVIYMIKEEKNERNI